MDCICKCWKDKELKIHCARCDGIVNYIKCVKVNEEDDIKIKIQKLKKELHDKTTDITILRMEIKDLEADIKDIEEEFKIKTVESASLPNCDCKSCN